MAKKSLEENVEKLKSAMFDAKAAHPSSMLKRTLSLLNRQITQLEELYDTSGMLQPPEQRMLSGCLEDVLKISKEYRDADIDPVEEALGGLTEGEIDDVLLKICIDRGILKKGKHGYTVTHFYQEEPANNVSSVSPSGSVKVQDRDVDSAE